MMGYWNSRTGRERGLIGVALLLVIVALLQFAIVRPLMAAKADSKLALEAASRQLDVVSAELTSQTTRAPPVRTYVRICCSLPMREACPCRGCRPQMTAD